MSDTDTRAGDMGRSEGRTVPVLTTTNAATASAGRMIPRKQDSCTEWLPPELLGLAFEHLPLHDAIAASHVSRYWRATALATPRLWATIRKTCRTENDFEFVKTLISRSGSIADVSVMCYHPQVGGLLSLESHDNDDNNFGVLIRPYLHKIRVLNWYSRSPPLSLRNAAPSLQRLWVTGLLDIPQDLLAGGSGTLRAFRCGIARLPAACPALSSVTELRLDDLQIDSAAAAPPRLFDLCPRLEILYVAGLRNTDAHFLLSGPAPASLCDVTLCSDDPECDLMQHFVALRTAKVRTFALKFENSGRMGLGSLPEAFLRGATALSIREPFGPRGSWFVATLPDAREHSMALPELCVPELAHRIVARSLQAIRTLDITIDVLEHFVAVIAAVPALERVTIRLETFEGSLGGGPRHPSTELVGWDALEYVQPVLDAAPKLRELVLDTLVSWNATGAAINARDAEFILSYLEFLDGRLEPVPEITILGFDAQTLRDVDLGGLPVRFDTQAGTDETPYWPFHVSYKSS